MVGPTLFFIIVILEHRSILVHKILKMSPWQCTRVEYVNHIISIKGVKVSNVKAKLIVMATLK